MAKKVLIPVAVAVIAATAGIATALAEDSPSVPQAPEGEAFFPAQAPPRARHIFTAQVVTRTEAARARYVSIDHHCWGAIFAKRSNRVITRLAATEATFPEGAAIPAVEVLSFKIPAKVGRPATTTVGKRFGYACSGTSVRILPNGDRVGQHGDGVAAPTWRITS